MDKCLPFGASISCSHYQCFSNSLHAIMEFRFRKKSLTNYLDDFLFIAITRILCNKLISGFLQLCSEINLPVAIEKTVWADSFVIFLGILLDGKNLVLCIPLEKQMKALNLVRDVVECKKVTVRELQVLSGYLNFLTRAIHPGHVFTRRIYAKYSKNALSGSCLKPHHHVKVDLHLKFDCEVWKVFLENYINLAICRPMLDLERWVDVWEVGFYSDASANKLLGFGAVCGTAWTFGQWEPGFIEQCKPSIEYLELFAFTTALLTWGDKLQNTKILIHCDNSSVVSMLNNISSSCKNCMYLLRLVVFNNLVNNRRIIARHVRSENNGPSDALSRLQFKRFWRLMPWNTDRYLTAVSPLLWPVTKIWNKVPKN